MILHTKCMQVLGLWSLSGLRFKYTMSCAQKVKVEVKQGTVIGRQHKLPSGKAYNCFKGLPYAVPPLGNLRFKSPVPLERFNETELDCSEHRDVSFQRAPFRQDIIGSENCLHLNVYAPEIKRSEALLPVMVWIHGGGFFFGDGNSEFFLPLTLLQENVIVVTLNYRLGAFGFLCLPEEGVWGNAGLKDQRLGLQWVHDNITKFHGDPNNVTLFGESAGAASVHLHVYAKHANKLFNKAILQSGTANMEWVFQANPDYKTRKLAEALGCTSTKTSDILEHLQSPKISPLDVLANTLSVLTADERRRGLPLPFKPVIEDASSPDSFINRPILEILQDYDTVKMPIIMGYNSAEGIVMLVNALRKMDVVDRDLARFAPRNIPLAPNDAGIQEITRKMRDFYLAGQALSPKLLNELVNLLSDYHFTVDVHNAAEWQARLQPHAPLYFFRFDYAGDSNIYKRIFQLEHLNGASHGDEMCYLFQMDATAEDSATVRDAHVVRQMCGLWASFARTGKPSDNQNATWQPVTKPKSHEPFVLNYLDMGNEDWRMRENPEQERIEFWQAIYKHYTAVDYSVLSSKL